MTQYNWVPPLILTLALAIATSTVYFTSLKSDSIKSLDTARVYTMMREKGDTQNALELLNDDKWIEPACLAMTDLSAAGNDVRDCRVIRTKMRDDILDHLKCTMYNSQVCSYIRLVMSSLAKNSAEWLDDDDHSKGKKIIGNNLAGKAPGLNVGFREVLYEAVEDAPNLFHGSYKAVQTNSFVIMRSMLYNLITWAVLGNFIVHVAVSIEWIENKLWSRMLLTGLSFFGTFFLSAMLVFVNSGTWGPLLLIGIPAFFNLGYFEMFLDPTMVRPWVHPYTFTIVYSSLSLLSLVENDVLSYSILIVEILKAQAASQLYMSVVWYWVGLQEKLRAERKLAKMYRTKEVQWGLYMTLIVVALLAITSQFAPYDYSYKMLFIANSPCMFVFLSLVCTLFLQDLRLDDKYDDASASTTEPGAPPTHITSSKLYVATLILGFITLVVFNLLGEHWRTYRATLDTVPDRAMQYDLSVPYLMGQGLTALRPIF